MRYDVMSHDELIEEIETLRARLAARGSDECHHPCAESEERLRQVIDLVPHMIFAKDRRGRFLLANQAVADAYGITVEDLMGSPHGDVHIADGELKKMLADDVAVIESGRPKHIYEEEFTDHRGEMRVLQTTKIPYRQPGSHEPAVLGVAVDVTRHRRLERVLAGESHVLQLLTQGTPLTDVLSALVRLIEEEYSDTLSSVLLLDRDGTHLRHASAPSLPPEYVQAVDGIAIGPAVGSCGTAAYCGTPVIVEDIAADPLWATFKDLALDAGLRSCWSQPILSSGGRVLGTFALYYRDKRRPSEDERSLIVAVARLAGVAIEFREAQEALEQEIVEHRRTAELLRLHEEEFRLVFENAPLGIVTVDDDGRFLRVNPAACEIFGYSEDELLQKTFLDITHPDDLEKSRRVHKSLSSSAPNTQVSLGKRYMRADGSVVDATVHTVAVPQRADQPMRRIAQIVDNTDRIRAEEEARQHREKLAHVSRVTTLGEMAASIAHEVNQPLTAIANYSMAAARMLRMRLVEPNDLLGPLEQVSSEAIRAGEIIHRMRALARGRDAGRSECDVNDLVLEVAKLAEVDARLQGVDIRLELSRELPEINGDGIQLQQVILNLIRNGVEASDGSNGEARLVRVQTGMRDEDHVQVSVIDYGAGVMAETQDQVFEPFFTTKERGMGMGLSIGRSIVTSHGGRMWFERNDGPGATFCFTLPV